MVNIYLTKDSELDDFRLYIQFGGEMLNLKDCEKLLNDKSAYWFSDSQNRICTYIGDSQSLVDEFKRLGGVVARGK